MTNSGRSKSARRTTRSASQMIIAGLLALAVIASVFLIFSNSVQLLRVGLVVALWAATLGAIAMTKYRRESALDKAKVVDLQTVYELQLEREISARREYELGVENRVRREVTPEAEELAALRAELATLRRNLEVLFEGGLLQERAALKTESTRVAELGGSSYSTYQPAASGLYVPGVGQSASQPPPNVGGLASPSDEPVTAETTVVISDNSWQESGFAVPRNLRTSSTHRAGETPSVPVPPKGPTAESKPAESKPVEQPKPPENPVADATPVPRAKIKPAVVKPDVVEPKPVEQPKPPENPVADATPVPRVKIKPDVVESEIVEPVDESVGQSSAVPDDAEPAPHAETASRRRRRAEPEPIVGGAHSNGLTVAEIMANLRSTDSDDSPGGRRRRPD
ncbi:outer membrane biosynthesis protein TonB [Rhodococcus sp. 27YEA15]|uniref:DUF6779 domain-containing protein n=1 Tax=Rhodococcus sp. 27YEA15 TaxID=3156259 RepID=UPI003C7C4DC4